MFKATSYFRDLCSNPTRVFIFGALVLSLVSIFSLIVGGNNQVSALTSSTINYQARLLQSNGAIAPDGNYNVDFKLYSTLSTGGGQAVGTCTSTGGYNCLWEETYTGGNVVTVQDGYLTVNLGSITSFPSTINWGNQLYLTMNIGGTGGSPTWDGEMTPRIQLTSVPYAFQANSALTANTLSLTSGSYTDILQLTTPAGPSNTITVPDAAGTVCLQGSATTADDCAIGSGSAILQNGNSFGTTVTIGSTTAYGINFITNNATVASLSATGAATFKNTANSTSAFQIQSTGSDNLFIADTTDNSIGIGVTPTTTSGVTIGLAAPNVSSGSGLDITSALNSTTNAQYGLNVNPTVFPSSPSSQFDAAIGVSLVAGGSNSLGNLVGLNGGVIYTGSSSVSNAMAINVANSNNSTGTISNNFGINIGDPTNGGGGAITNNAALQIAYQTVGSTSDYAILAQGPTNPIFSLSNTGNILSENSTNSAAAFQVDNSTGASILNVDTNNSRVDVGTNGTATSQLYVSGNVPTTNLGSVSTSSGPSSVYTVGRYAYVANTTSNTLQVIDVSNSASPVVTGTSATTGLSSPRSVYVQGNHAYVANNTGATLQIFDVSNPTSPSSVGSVATGSGPQSVYVQGRYAYVVNVTSNTLQVIDVSNPASPVVAGTSATTGLSSPRSVYVQGRYAYVANSANATMQIFDVSNPASPTSVGSVTTGTAPYSVYVQGRYAYVVNNTSNTLQVIDVSNPASPTVTGTSSTSGMNAPQSVYVQGRYAYVANLGGNTLQAFDVSNPASPTSVGSVTTGTHPYSIYVSGRYAYVVNNTGNTLQTFDLGGSYIQQLEAGGAEVGTLSVDTNASIAGGESISGSLGVGQSLDVSGNTAIGGTSNVVGNSTANSFLAVSSTDALDAAAAGVLNIGVNTATSLQIGSTTNTTSGVTISTAGNYTVSGVAASVFTEGAAITTGSITIGGTAQTGSLTVGSSSGASTVFIANGAGASTVTIANGIGGNAVNINNGAGTNTTKIGTAASINTITIGSTNSTSSISELVGTGNYALNGAATSTYTIGGATTTGTILIGGTAQTGAGTLTVGSSTASNTENIGIGNGATTLNLGTGTGANVIQVGSTTSSSGTQTIGLGDNATAGSTTNLTIGSTVAGTFSLQDATTISLNTPNAQFTALSGGTRTLNVATQGTNVAGSGLTIQAGAAGTGASAFSGGTLLLQGGNAGGTGNANGANVALQGGAGDGSGVQGLVTYTATAFLSVAYSTASSATITQADIDNDSTVAATASAASLTLTVPSPTITTAGRILYLSNAGATNAFTVAATGLTSFTLNTASTATLLWNGSAWTSASYDAGSASYIQNQNAASQTANYRISGTGQAAAFDAAAAGVLNIGITTATSLQIGSTTNTTSGVTISTAGNYTVSGVAASVFTEGAAITTGSITIGGTAQTGNLTVGSSSGSSTVFIANGGGASTVTIANGTGGNTVNINNGAGTNTTKIGTAASINTITIGSTNSTSALNLYAGTGNFLLNGAATSTYAIGGATTTGTILIGGTAQTGAGIITLGSSTATSTVLIANGSGNSTVTIAGGAGNNTVNINNAAGTNATNIGTAASINTITIGSTNSTSALLLQAGSGNLALTTGTTTGDITLITNNASSNIIAKSSTNNTTAFEVENTGATPIATVDTTNDKLILNSTVSGTSALQFAQLNSTSIASSNFSQLLGVDSSGNVGLSTAGVALTSPALAYWDGLNDPTVTGQSYPLATITGANTSYSSGNGEQLTTAGTNETGSINWNFSQVPFEETQFQFKAGGGSGADATWFYSYADATPTTEFGTGFTKGYIIYFSEYHDCAGISYGPYTDNNQCNNANATSGSASMPLTSHAFGAGVINDSSWHNVDIQIRYNVITVRWDGVVIMNYTDIYTRDTSALNFGFGARTGGSTDDHYIKGLVVTKLGNIAGDYGIDTVSPITGNLYWDSVNNYLGVDTSAPSAALDVAGTALFTGSTSATDFQVQNATSVNLLTVNTATSGTAADSVIIGSGSVGDSTGYLLGLDNKTSAGDPTEIDGAMYYNSSSDVFRCGVSGEWQDCAGGLSSNSAVATDASCNSACGAFTTAALGANSCEPGKVIHILIDGVWGTASTIPTIQLGVYFGTSATRTSDNIIGIVSPTFTDGTQPTAQAWQLDYSINCYTTGTSGTIMGEGHVDWGTAATAFTRQWMQDASTTTMNTTIAENIYVFPIWGTSSGTNTITADTISVTTN